MKIWKFIFTLLPAILTANLSVSQADSPETRATDSIPTPTTVEAFQAPSENRVSQDASEEFQMGNAAYKEGDYATALDHYLLAEEHLEGLAINYNIGNAYFKLGQIPESILHYERALKFDPDNGDILYNLSLARELIADRIEALPKSKFSREWQAFRYEIGPGGWAAVSIGFSALAAALLLLFYLGRGKGWRRLGFFGGLIALGLTVGAYTLARSAQNYRYAEHAAVVFSPKVDIKSEPRGGSINVFTLHAGTKVHLLGKEGEWYEVRIASGDRGWVHQNDIRVI